MLEEKENPRARESGVALPPALRRGKSLPAAVQDAGVMSASPFQFMGRGQAISHRSGREWLLKHNLSTCHKPVS